MNRMESAESTLVVRTKYDKYFLYLLPIFVILSTAVVFMAGIRLFGKELGYLLGFGFYYGLWCLFIPLIFLGKDGFLSLFKEQRPFFTRENRILFAMIVAVILGTLIFSFLPYLPFLTLTLFLVTIPISIINAFCEEILWRGLYIRAFSQKIFGAIIFPAIGFALWHLSPDLVYPRADLIIFIISTLIFGLALGYIAFKRDSILLTIITHTIACLLAFSIPISTSLIAVLGL